MTCRDCGRDMVPSYTGTPGQLVHRGRGLCPADYDMRLRRGTLPARSRPYMRSSHVIEEWSALALEGFTRVRIAQILGMSENSLTQVILRWKKKNAQ